MGDKAGAKRLMAAAGVPCIPGFESEDPADQSPERLTAEAARIQLDQVIAMTSLLLVPHVTDIQYQRIAKIERMGIDLAKAQKDVSDAIGKLALHPFAAAAVFVRAVCRGRPIAVGADNAGAEQAARGGVRGASQHAARQVPLLFAYLKPHISNTL
jgi:acetyl/propionyl-CoA carboxylase alpha subunit